MATNLSRSKLARHLAKELTAGRGAAAVDELAAYLIETRRTSEAELIVRSSLEYLERDGHVLAHVTTAYEVGDELKARVAALLKAQTLEIDAHIDPQVLGGIRVQTPTRVLDTTIVKQLQTLRESKV